MASGLLRGERMSRRLATITAVLQGRFLKSSPNKRCARYGFWIFWGPDLCCLQQGQEGGFLCRTGCGFWVFWEKGLTKIYAESNRSRIACVMLVPDSDWKVSKQDRIRTQIKQSPHTYAKQGKKTIRNIYDRPHAAITLIACYSLPGWNGIFGLMMGFNVLTQSIDNFQCQNSSA